MSRERPSNRAYSAAASVGQLPRTEKVPKRSAVDLVCAASAWPALWND
jgi:hypothetical protein